MGTLCDPVDVMALRDIRQKRYAKIQPQFDIKYGAYYPDGTLWRSQQDDLTNGMFLYSYNLNQGTASNVSIALPSSEVFHVQATGDQTYYGSDEQVSYTYDAALTDYVGEQTISNGVTLTYTGSFFPRDKPWVKYGITWDCYATLEQQERSFLGYSGENNTPIWSAWQTIATTPYYWFHQIEPDVNDGIGPYTESNSLFIPQGSYAEPGPGGSIEIGAKDTRYLGSISVGNINTYRRGDYHHA